MVNKVHDKTSKNRLLVASPLGSINASSGRHRVGRGCMDDDGKSAYAGALYINRPPQAGRVIVTAVFVRTLIRIAQYIAVVVVLIVNVVVNVVSVVVVVVAALVVVVILCIVYL